MILLVKSVGVEMKRALSIDTPSSFRELVWMTRREKKISY